MRAKEYAEQYHANTIISYDLAMAFYEETLELIKCRHAYCDAAFNAIFDEMDRKWKAFCRLVPDFKPEGYQIMLKQVMPEVYQLWKEDK